MRKEIISQCLKKIFIMGSIVACVPFGVDATWNEKILQQKFTQPYEQTAEELFSLIAQGQFVDVETFIDTTLRNGEVTQDGMRYFSALLRYWFHQDERVTPFPIEILPRLSGWIASEPDNAIAHIIRGVCYIEYAYEEANRLGGGKIAKEESSKLHTFYRRLTVAKDDLITAYTLEPTIPESTLHLLRIVRFFQDIPLNAEELFQHTKRLAPTSYLAYRVKLTGFIPRWPDYKWDSSYRENVMAFARKTAEQAPQQTLLPLLLVHAHHEAARGYKTGRVAYYKQPHIWNEIQTIYLQLIRDFPQSERWKTEFAKMAFDTKHDEVATKYLEMAFQSSPRYVETYLSRIEEYYSQHQWEVVEQYARQLVLFYPEYAKGYNYLGWSLMYQERFQEAVENFSVAIHLAPVDARYWIHRCYANHCLGDNQQAVNDCTEAIQLDNYPYIFEAYRFRAMAHEQLGNEQAAREDAGMASFLDGK